MGYYIQTPDVNYKAMFLVQKHGATLIDRPPQFDRIPTDKSLICVVDNVLFEAAGYVYNAREYDAFSDPGDGRRKTWLYLDRQLARQLTGAADDIAKGYLNETDIK